MIYEFTGGKIGDYDLFGQWNRTIRLPLAVEQYRFPLEQLGILADVIKTNGAKSEFLFKMLDQIPVILLHSCFFSFSLFSSSLLFKIGNSA